MTPRLRFRADARAEFRHSFEWYRGQSPIAAARLVEETRALLLRIAESPRQFPRVGKRTRRGLLSSFPYTVYFDPGDEHIVILGFTHTHRAPRRWD